MNDIFRQEYTPLTEEQKQKISEIKSKAQELHDLINDGKLKFYTPEFSRCITQSQWRLEEAIMWAVKGWSAPPQKDLRDLVAGVVQGPKS